MARALARAAGVVGGVVAPLLLLGCAGAQGESLRGSPPPPAPDRDAPRASSPHLADSTPSRSPAAATPQPSAGSDSQPPPPSQEPRRSNLSIPALGLRSVPVVRYVGSPDDAE